MKKETYGCLSGRPHPLGATPDENGVNFSVFSEHASSVELLLFSRHDDPEPAQVFVLDPKKNNSFHFWHIYVKGLKLGAVYAFRVDGERDPAEHGFRFDQDKVLIDPYARGNTNELWDRQAACVVGDNMAKSMRSVVIDTSVYDWEGDKPLKLPMSKTVIYELHVGGFTKSPTSKASHPGKFKGLIEKIPYLKDLGVTAVELMPVMDFDSSEYHLSPDKSKLLKNYWGYGTIGYFAPESSYCVSPNEGTHTKEFRDMVKAFHKAGIEVILDVVFGYSGEGDEHGPTISFRGFDNPVYYLLSPQDRNFYMNFSGCGNTFRCNHPIVSKFIIDCLEFWVREMHVDGFRFDEASILSRGEDGNPIAYPPVLWNIELSKILSGTKVIAEAWDAAGLYQVGYFPGYRYSEWNGHFRDDVRRFVRGDPGMVGAVAERIAGSPDLYQPAGRLPANSINFVACHDGLTINDLVSYAEKHNQDNGFDNSDGINENLSYNYGAEGATDDKAIEQTRLKQIKNFFTILMLSRGTPMISMGDEIRRTQLGNNNTYCQDSEISWLNWDNVRIHASLLGFVKKLIGFRKNHEEFCENSFFTGEVNPRGLPDIAFHGCHLYNPGWSDPSSRVLSFTIGGKSDNQDIHVVMNMDFQPLDFEIPEVGDRKWFKVIDTSLDISFSERGDLVEGRMLTLPPRSIVVLTNR
ncbi:MAG: glycogen debranching protein GlgX [Candidatus Berkelbacteria bacterium]|nr:glycogen debranching protein GlgX [Candidatus Berkelbacteria bacterium]